VKSCATSLGRIAVNAGGRSLYLFETDRNGKSACYGSCATYWPPLLTRGKPVAGAGVKAKLLGVTKWKNGTL
jgi:predicted lipoprotein with Yx(FWY)xxD motif